VRNFWCEVNLDQLDANIANVRQSTNKELMAVIKANAYGIGIEDFTFYLNDKVDCFGVANMEEALRVRSGKDVLLLYPEFSDEDILNVKDNFVLTVDNQKLLDRLKATGKSYRVHIYVDTGMNRFGIKPEKLKEFYELIERDYPEIKVEGIFTHLHNTKDQEYTEKQIALFEKYAGELKDKVKYIHMLSSGGFLKYSSRCTIDNMVRLGNILYGYDAAQYGYKRIFSYKAKPVRVYTVDKGEYIGYGCLFKTSKPTRVAILDFGFADNFTNAHKRRKNIFMDIAKTVYYHFKYYSGIYYKGRNMHIIGEPNMNFILINLEDVGENETFDIDMTTLDAESSIPKRWKRGEEYVQL
jgi:alanine racemase